MTPAELDRHKWLYRGMKPQRGGWNQALWLVVNDVWFRATSENPATLEAGR